MTHRVVSAVIASVLALACAAALVFALGVTPVAAAPRGAGTPPVPHGTAGVHAACRDCHVPAGAARALPPTHRSFGTGTCGGCHRVTSSGSPSSSR